LSRSFKNKLKQEHNNKKIELQDNLTLGAYERIPKAPLQKDWLCRTQANEADIYHRR
jgi:hypothetical protein